MTQPQAEVLVRNIVENVTADAMADDYVDAMMPFDGQLPRGWQKMIATVFESGVRVGASRAILRILGEE